MIRVTVTDVVDGDTFVCDPPWEFGGQSGDRIRPVGYDAPERGAAGAALATALLATQIKGKAVCLDNPVSVDRGRLVCTVVVDGVNLADLMKGA